MVYRSEQSASPPQRELSRSPPPEAAANAGPSQRRGKLTFADKRRIEGMPKSHAQSREIILTNKVEKLLSNPDRQVALPQPTKEKTLRAPQELVKNVQPTASAAGSGEFHVYKHARRREAERLKIMDDRAKALEEQAAFQARQQARDAEADAKTAKNRAKRQKRKQGRKAGAGGDDEDGNGRGGQAGEPKRKLAGGGAPIATNDSVDGAETDSAAARTALHVPDVVGGGAIEGQDNAQAEGAGQVAESLERAKARAIETSIVIRDDD